MNSACFVKVESIFLSNSSIPIKLGYTEYHESFFKILVEVPAVPSFFLVSCDDIQDVPGGVGILAEAIEPSAY